MTIGNVEITSVPEQPNPADSVANTEVNQKLLVDTKLENLLKNNQDLTSLIIKFKDTMGLLKNDALNPSAMKLH